MTHKCTICGFIGVRSDVRKHIMTKHKIKSEKKLRIPKEAYESNITRNMVRV